MQGGGPAEEQLLNYYYYESTAEERALKEERDEEYAYFIKKAFNSCRYSRQGSRSVRMVLRREQEMEIDPDAADTEIEKAVDEYIENYRYHRYQEGLNEMTPYEYGCSLLAA